MHRDMPNCLCKNHRTEETGKKILQKRQGANWPRTCVFKQLDEVLKKGRCASDALHCWQARRAQNKAPACSKSDVRSNSSCSLVGSDYWGAMTIEKRGVTEPSGLERQTSLELTSKEPEFDERAISVAKSGTCCCVDTGALGPQHIRR